jgi:hypothetical protein
MSAVALSRICLLFHHKPEILSGSSDAHDDGHVILLWRENETEKEKVRFFW